MIPLLWINLNRAEQRRKRMTWAIQQGGWSAHRFIAIDAADPRHQLLPLPNPLHPGTALPGLWRSCEAEPKRRTNRAELACLASWKRAVLLARTIHSPSGWLLLMEDDLGASLASPEAWAHTLMDLISSCPQQTLAIQLAPISATVRQMLATQWRDSGGRCLSLPKEEVRSHGNGAVLLNQKALAYLVDPFARLSNRWQNHWHPLIHPWRIRPVADKWLYGSLPKGSSRVATYPHFCLEAEDSNLHQEHVRAFHQPSREITLEIWKNDEREDLLYAQRTWDSITAPN